MGISVGALISVLSSPSPFAVTGVGKSDDSLNTQATILSPDPLSQNALNIAYSFSPNADIAKLSSEGANVLLTAQAQSFLSPPEPAKTSTRADFSRASTAFSAAADTGFKISHGKSNEHKPFTPPGLGLDLSA